MAPPRILMSTARRLYKASGLADRVRLAFSDCLGPCSEANVVLLYLDGAPRDGDRDRSHRSSALADEVARARARRSGTPRHRWEAPADQ
jgi:hypothetical protein